MDDSERRGALIETQEADAALDKALLYADAFVNKNYLIHLEQYPLEELDLGEDAKGQMRFYRIERLVYSVGEDVNDKLISVYNAFFNIQAAGALVIRSTPTELGFYIGVRSEEHASTAQAILERTFRGNFAGSVIRDLSEAELGELFGSIDPVEGMGGDKSVASVSIVPSTRDDSKERFVQGIEKFIDAMKGSSYMAIFLAEPLDKEVLETRKRGLQGMYTGLSPFAQTQLSYGVNVSRAVSVGMSKSFSSTLSHSLSDTTSNFSSTSRSRNSGRSFGLLGMGVTSGTSSGVSSGNSWAHAVTEGTSETTGESVSNTETDTVGDSRTVTVTSENKFVKYILDKIDRQLERIKRCEAFGLWDVACYFISEDVQTAVIAAGAYKALMAGFDSGVENSYVNIWTQDGDPHTNEVLRYLSRCTHPRFMIPADDEYFEIGTQSITPCSLISGNELPYIMGLPRHSVSGVTVLNMAEFGRNVRLSGPGAEGDSIEIGHIFHMGETEPARVGLDLQSFRSHCFITGSTGAGKSNTTYKILDEMIARGIPFLVIEPAKGEYKRKYGGLAGLNVFCTNPRYYGMLRINPFRFNEGIHVLEHLDRLIEIFNACWPLYAAMPAILKEAFERSYIKCGWDLERSIHIPNGHSKFPTFRDVLETLPEIISSSAYSSDSKGDYTGALVTRVRSLTNGIAGQVLCAASEIDEETLFDHNAIVDLSRVSSAETKSLLMGILILKLNEYRMCGTENQPLRHITVLEEAHNILKRAPVSSGEGVNVQAKSVEMIGAAIAEMRTYGEGFIIVDQSPTAVDASAIKNTNTKIVMRLPDYEDCKIAGLSMGLSDDQIREISRFPMGVAAVYQNNWVEAVLVKVDRSMDGYYAEDLVTEVDALARVMGKLTAALILQYESMDEEGFDAEELLTIIERSPLNGAKKGELRQRVVDFCAAFDAQRPVNGTFALGLSEFVRCDGLFEAIPIAFAKDYSEETQISRVCMDEHDVDTVKGWQRSVLDSLDGYLLIDNEHLKKRVLRYLLLARRLSEMDTNKYHLIYEGLYGRRDAR